MASNMAPPTLFKTPEEIAAESSMNNNDSTAQHVSHLPPVVDPSTASITATKPSTLPQTDTTGLIHPGPNSGLVHPPAGAPPALRTPQGLSQEPSDQWAARALDAIAPSEQGQSTSVAQQSYSAVSTPGLEIPGSFPRSAIDKNASPDVDLEYVKQVAVDVANTVVQTAKTAVGYVQENGPAAAATTRDAAGTAAVVVADTTSNVAATVAPIASNAASAVGNTASNAAGTIGNTASSAAGTIGNSASNAAGTIGNSASNAAGTVGNTASNAAGSVGNTMVPVTSSVGSTVGGVGSTVREYAATAGDAIKPYVPAAVAGVLPSHAPTSTGIDSFTGDGVARLPEETRTKGFPSNDDEGFTPLGKTGGVGALPGSAQESGVAVLPDEKLKEGSEGHSTRVAPFHGEVTLKGDGVPSGLPKDNAPEVSTHAPLAPASNDKAIYNAPIGPDSSKAPNVGTPTLIPEGKMHDKTYVSPIGPEAPSGASAHASMKVLPGSKKASKEGLNSDFHGIGHHDPANHHPRTHMGATLAEINSERHELGHPPADNRPPHVPPKDRLDSDAATTGHGAPVPTTTNLLGHADPSAGAGLKATSFTSVDNGLSNKSGAYTTTDTAGRESAGHRTKDTTANVTSSAGNAATAPGLSMGHTAGVHPETHPTYGKDDGAKASAAGDHSLNKTSSPTDSSDSKGEKKSGFMSKLKGEVKVISGKLSHNEAKVEEGRKLMGKN